jgi:transposase
MLSVGTTGNIYLGIEPQDGRKGIDGLAGVVRSVLARDPASGDLFVFKNRRGDRLKILAWTNELAITATQLAMILSGIELSQTRTRTRFQKSA